MARIRMTARALAVGGLAVVALGVPVSSQAAAPKLVATVGPGFTISLKTPSGARVTSLRAGTYAITVNDRSAMHDFRLRGPGVNRVISGVSAVGRKTVTVRLVAGRYQFVCQPHAAAMRGAFTVR
jgi:plastocyanin